MREEGHKVLVIDMDCQGNTTELMTGKSSIEFNDHTVLEAIYERNPKKYIVEIDENLHLLGANNLLITLVDFYYTHYTHDMKKKYPYKKHKYKMLDETIKKIKKEYDYILIDTPPSLGTETLNALYTSDYVVVMFEASKFCYSAIPNFLETIQGVMHAGNTELTIAGLLRTLNDVRRVDMRELIERVEYEYSDMIFSPVIKRTSKVGRIPLLGFEQNEELEVKDKHIGKEDKDPLALYRIFYKELLERVGEQQRQVETSK